MKKNWAKAYNKAADYANRVLIPQINEKYTRKYGVNWFSEASKNNAENYQRYMKEYEDLFNQTYNETLESMIGKRPQ